MKYILNTERIYCFAPNINIVVAVKLNNTNTQDLIDSINFVCNENLIISSKIVKGEIDLLYYEISKRNIDLKVINNSNWIEAMRQEENSIFDLDNGPLIRFRIINNNNSLFLVVIAHHTLCDGKSIIYLLNDITNHLNKQNHFVLTKSVNLIENKDVTKLSWFVRKLIKYLNKTWEKETKKFNNAEYRILFDNYHKHHIVKTTVSSVYSKELKLLLEKSKEHNITLNSILTTALLAATNETKAGLAINIRDDDNSFGNLSSAISIHYKYNSKINFYDNCKKVHKKIYKKLNNKRNKLFLLQFLKELNPNLIDAMYFNLYNNYQSKAAKLLNKILGYKLNPKGLAITNLGKVELDVDDIIFAPPLVGNTDKIFGVVTNKDKMNIVIQYDSKNEYVKEYADKVLTILENNS